MLNKDTILFLIDVFTYIGCAAIYYAMQHYRKRYEQLRSQYDAVDDFLSLYGAPFLVSVERHNRSLIFTFNRDGEFIEVETMALMSTDINSLMTKLGLNDHEPKKKLLLPAPRPQPGIWERSATIRPFVLATTAALASFFVIEHDGRTARTVFVETFNLERNRAQGEL